MPSKPMFTPAELAMDDPMANMRAELRERRAEVDRAVAAAVADANTREVTLIERDQYGVKVYYPGCALSRVFSLIARQKTITLDTIVGMKALGYVVRVQGKPEVTL